MSLRLYLFVLHVPCCLWLGAQEKKKGNFEIGSQPVVHSLKRKINAAKCQ